MQSDVPSHQQTKSIRTNRRQHAAIGGLSLAALPLALAQAFAQSPDASDLDRVVVTGIRGSLESSLNLKRDATGIVDGIIAEDIGKFPDMNLAESLQRISGVSISRSNNGEGVQVTVRGVGPAFNMVLLNNRQMPNTISGSRAFNFSYLASEAVSELQVYKTVHADVPTGGIGATINVKTARPLDNPGFHATTSVKGLVDKSNRNSPRSYRGSSVTPEVAGIFSNTFADGRFGVAGSFSYQERDSGYSQASVGNWAVFRGEDGTTNNRIPLETEAAYEFYKITNRPGPGDIYVRPQNFVMHVNANRRQRRNGQVAFQFAPTDNITTTLDYTYADNRSQGQRSEMMAWLGFPTGDYTFTKGPIAVPTIYKVYVPEGTVQDLGSASEASNSRSELKSLGFNAEWRVNDALDLKLDYHDSRAETRPDHPFGSGRRLGAAMAFVRGDTTIDFSNDLPIFHVDLAPGITELGPYQMRATNANFRNDFSHSEVQQWQAHGTFRFAGYQALDFGAAYTDVYNRTANASINTASSTGAWWPDGSVSTPDDYDDDIWVADDMRNYFTKFKGLDDPQFSGRFMVGDFERLHQRVMEITGRPDWYTGPSTYTTDRRTFETSTSGWLQWRNTFDWTIPVNVSAGIRYEKTEVISPAQVRPPAGNVSWYGANEMRLVLEGDFVETLGTGEYDYWLPNLDIRADLRDNLVLRGSAGKSIGRAGWGSLLGGLSNVTNFSAQTGPRATRGNPGLLPLEAKNFDLSLEWYYTEGSYAALGYFRKNIRNFSSNTTIQEQPYPVRTPVGGAFWNEAITAGGCLESNMSCIRSYIFTHHADDPSVNYTGMSGGGDMEGTITGRDSDPILTYDISIPTNQRADYLDGFELNVQHMFGNSGFGMAANYTKVDSGLRYDNLRIGTQTPMVGLADSANLVGFYEKYGWRVRAAYSWRDEFLSGTPGSAAGGGNNPVYTERYHQLDMNVTYLVNQHLSVFVEAINLTNETMRTHGRHRYMLGAATQNGARYLFGVRYKF